VSAENWLLFASALVPVALAIVVYWYGMKIARRSEERQRELDKRS
jgi:hypothetical protein